MKRTTVIVGMILEKIKKIATTIKFKMKVRRAVITADRTIIIFGKLTFLIRSPLPTIEFIPVKVASAKNVHITIPTRR
jgi:hypothetical protein